MILYSPIFDQRTIELMIEHDPVVQESREWFSHLDFRPFQGPRPTPKHSKRGSPAHPETAYVKAFLLKIKQKLVYMTELRHYLVQHPLLVLELGFCPEQDKRQPYGFDVHKTVPSASWLRTKLKRMDQNQLDALFEQTVHTLQEEIPGLGETIAVDVKHIYAWVRENNVRESIANRFDKEHQPRGDPDCKVGVKKSTNQEQVDGSVKVKKEYLWGYGTGIVSALVAGYGDVVLARYTQPFNENDVTYYLPLYRQTVATLGFFPTYVTADAAFDAWYVYETAARHGGIAAIPLNQHGHPIYTRDADGVPRCSKGLRMQPTYRFQHTRGYQAQRYRCPLLHPEPTGQSCDHEQFAKEKGCVKDSNIEAGGLMRVTLNRDGPLYHVIYCQRTSAERINSQAKELGIERPKVRNGRSVDNLNTLTYIVINVQILQKSKIHQ